MLANRGPCSAAELEIEFGGVAEITLVTHIDLSVYAEMVSAEEIGTGACAREEAEPEPAGAGTSTGTGRRDAVEENLRRIRDLATKNASKLIGAVAKKLVGVPISVTIRVRRLAGTLRVWIPPPPGDRLWFGFVDEPEGGDGRNPVRRTAGHQMARPRRESVKDDHRGAPQGGARRPRPTERGERVPGTTQTFRRRAGD